MAVRMANRRFVGSMVAAAFALAVGACSSGAGAPPAGEGVSPSPGAAPGAVAPAGTRVTVQMTDYHLALPRQTFTPGTYTFIAVNAGQTVHALQIAGPGVPGQRTGVVQPGQSAKLTVTLEPGSYEVYCPVDGHKAEGMDTTITVSGPGETGG